LNAFLIASIFALAQTAPASTSYEQASKEITILLQQGNDDSACADLAKTLIDEVTATVDASNKLLGALDDGSSCPNEGQEAVTTAQSNKDDADKAASDAAEAASGAADAEVDFGSFSLSSLTPGECGQFWEDEAYKSAKAAQATTATAQTEADAKAKVAAEAVDDATTAAAAAVQACQCKVRAAYDLAWAAATEKQDADAAAYTKGKHMQCVLQGTAAADCDVGDAPQVTPVTLADGVPAEPCDATEPEPEPEPEFKIPDTFPTGCKSGGTWERPYGDVANSEAGVTDCATKCKSGGYAYFGLECPRATVHCQCANTLSGSNSIPSEKCDRSIQTGSHCSGPYKAGSYMLGSHGTGSVYRVGGEPVPVSVSVSFTKSGKSGYLHDTGAAFGTHTDHQYGWLCGSDPSDQTAGVRDWGNHFDRNNKCSGTTSWQMKVPNGDYNIKVILPREKHTGCKVQGEATGGENGKFVYRKNIKITDGTLTLSGDYPTCHSIEALVLEPGKEWHLSAGKSTSCDSGVQATQAECEAAVASLASAAGKTPARSLQVGSGGSCGDGGWGGVPAGCGAQSHGDWAAHFKTSGPNCNNGAYQVVCSGEA